MNFVDPGGHNWLNDLRSGISKAGSQISKSATQALQTLTKAGKETLSYIRTMLNLAQEDASKSCKLISFIDGMINELLYNTLEPVAEAGDYAVSVFGQKWTLAENYRSVYSGMESGLLNHEFTDAKSYYAGKIFGDILSIALGVGMGVASASILDSGIAASIGITVLSDGVGVTVSVGTLVVTVAVSGVVLLEGIAIMTSAVGNIGDNFNNFANDGGKGQAEIITNNQGKEIDITPEKNHLIKTKNPGPYGEANSSVDILDENGKVKTRRWYDSEGHAYRDVDMTNHGNPKEHPEWPHEHTWDWSTGKPIRN